MSAAEGDFFAFAVDPLVGTGMPVSRERHDADTVAHIAAPCQHEWFLDLHPIRTRNEKGLRRLPYPLGFAGLLGDHTRAAAFPPTRGSAMTLPADLKPNVSCRDEILTSGARRRYPSRNRGPSAGDSPHAGVVPCRLPENTRISIPRRCFSACHREYPPP